MVTATSHNCIAFYPEYGIELHPGVPKEVPNDPAIIAHLKTIEGVVVVETPDVTTSTTATATATADSSEEK